MSEKKNVFEKLSFSEILKNPKPSQISCLNFNFSWESPIKATIILSSLI